MYSLTNKNSDNYCHIYCDCGRSFVAEEMYVCFECNKLKCRFCLTNEYEIFSCRNKCIKKSWASSIGEKKRKNRCSICLQCPLCKTALFMKKYIEPNEKKQEVVLSECPNCKWNSFEVGIIKNTEEDFQKYLTYLEELVSEGLLHNIYENSLKKLKESYENKKPSNKEFSGYGDFNYNDVQEALNDENWDMSKLEESLNEKQKEFNNKQSTYNYINDYLTSSGKNDDIIVFGFIKPFLGCALDYEEKRYLKYDTVDDLTENIKNYFELEHISTFEQRHDNICLQNPLNSKLYPNFVEMIPQKDDLCRKCKICSKNIVMAEKSSKGSEIKYGISHFYIKNFPTISLYKLDLENKRLLVKFSKLDTKEIAIKIEEDVKNECLVTIPNEKYQIGTLDTSENNRFIFNQTDQYLILIFQFQDNYIDKLNVKGSQHFLKLKIIADYSREYTSSNTKEINYKVDIKFTIPK